ncbi:MAG: cyclodeaminase/cyclohydrolase family protein, partial [Clostridia bacterium]|nr:cyclodeaminase/cyclohydrolase family protein [Clostridia bacterium]
TLAELPPLLSVLFEKGSRLALSDVGGAAALCSGAAESAHLNIFVNTGLMKDRIRAEELEGEADRLLMETVNACDHLYTSVRDRLSGTK